MQVLVGFWVYIPPLDTKREVERKIAELQRAEGLRSTTRSKGRGR